MTTDYLAGLCTSRLTCKLIPLFVLHPARKFYYAQVIEAIGEDRGNTWHALRRLEMSGFLRITRKDYRTYYELNPDCPVIPELQRIVVASRQYPG